MFSVTRLRGRRAAKERSKLESRNRNEDRKTKIYPKGRERKTMKYNIGMKNKP